MLSYSITCQALNRDLTHNHYIIQPSQLLQGKILFFTLILQMQQPRGPKRLSNSANNTVTGALRFKRRSHSKSLALDPQRSHWQLTSKVKLTKWLESREHKKLEICVSQSPAAATSSGSTGTLIFKWDKIVVTHLLNKFPDLFKMGGALRNIGMIAGGLASLPLPPLNICPKGVEWIWTTCFSNRNNSLSP